MKIKQNFIDNHLHDKHDCKPNFIRDDLILQFMGDEMVRGDKFSRP